MAQIAFLTLFLGLTFGSQQPIELTVTGPVVAVELLLDGAPAGRITGPPWKGQIDFGPSLVPHELVARALNEQGQEIGTIRQWVNLPRPPAEVDVLLESGPAGRPVAARLTWQSLTGERPTNVQVTFDDKPLAAEPDGRIQLPAWDPEASHVLSVELHFADAPTARRDVVFGGRWGTEVSTELTAVPVRLRRGKKLPSPQHMEGWFRAGGQPAAVAAVEEGPAELLIVRDLELPPALDHLAGGIPARPSMDVNSSLDQNIDRRREMSLDKETSIRFILPVARPVPGTSRPADLFGQSRAIGAGEGGILWLLAHFVPSLDNPPPQRLADAVAVAGLQTLNGNRRRAVLLALSEQAADASRSNPDLVRRYLEAIRVPLFVWTAGNPAAPPAAAWGGAERVGTIRGMRKAFDRLERDLASQRIVWIEGRHLPQSIELSAEAAAVFELVR